MNINLSSFPSSDGATPAMAQWFALKAQEPEALLFFRMGDFYELFFNDAEAAAMALDIALTTRGQHAGNPIPMCGVPVAAAPAYLARLIRRGFRVAVAEQTQSAPKPGEKPLKGPLTRAIVRVVTPGTLTEDELLEAGRQNLLLALAHPPGRVKRNGPVGVAWIDISTGAVETQSLPAEGLAELLVQLDPAEILAAEEIIPPAYADRRAPPVDGAKTSAAAALDAARRTVARAFDVAQISVLGDFTDEEAIACAMALDYVRRSQAGNMPRLSRPMRRGEAGTLGLDPATRASLDLLQGRDGTTTHTLLDAVSRTVTAAGSRLIATWIAAPSTDAALIARRQEAWCWLRDTPSVLASLTALLRRTPDLARALGRLSTGRGQPRDLAAIRDALHTANAAVALLQPASDARTPALIREITAGLYGRADTLLETLERALAEDLPLKLEDGGVIAQGFDETLDRHRALRDDSRKHLAALQLRYVDEFGVPNLKIRHHAQLGYIIETSASAAARLRDREGVMLRQGTANLARFSTPALADLDRAILDAGERAAVLERQIFNGLVAQAVAHDALPEVATLFALTDVLQSAAVLAQGGAWCRPDVTEDQQFELHACRHPVVEAALERGARFVPNNCMLPPAERVMLLTGPNMAGKSTFLRQTALAVILAQAGLPVPARAARIGIVDRLFSRVGAADDLARGRSTFMVEMTETAAILRQAGPRSLVVVDEIGRGTATLDGLAIAWATLEALHSQLGARTIFATHFHELGMLTDSMPRLTPYTMAVREWQGDVIFQHEVRSGAARKSWGVHVAQLAGVPEPVVRRASRLLAALERDHARTRPALPLFETEAEQAGTQMPDRLRAAIEALDPDSLSPKEALQAIYDLRKLMLEQNGPLA
ncbi:DNA mismatch repair protein MutS [Neoasaia chiangmaiensis NBRC 101099]|uniref:DNA mismatch repair protein MutS n=2 Tax=Neoasaia chiangmaiensis TaxID=320497 RepID=A0A1U9KN47_9PROT|nr:DNA mismatch repair protein MutS [Neoasaia chiangmaiensis]AQS87216.1 DNA mismatch repair protein MutS [Neoasaia chiangmaiensis]GBR38365.1 DNA mismatch repair protein MutS [Neoasaia chiangmaiensis NBRC 101099]GEN15930.1 DNA mismatch repair protein MutS [Neoasaia chiangmaiensis]